MPVPTAEGEAARGTSRGIETAGADTEKRSSDSSFPTVPEVPRPSVSSNVRKAQVRAALFRKMEPVRVARFILLERLGAGAMGEIYAAYDEQLDRRVALKLVRHGSELTAKADELLLREAQALAQVSHPNVVQIYEAGAHEGRLFIAMELIRGQTLTRWLTDAARMPRPHRQREILRRFIAAGRGLEAAHAAGVAHRDFKPDNVLVGDDGRVRVVDFGLARALVDVMAPGSSGMTTSGADLVAMDEDFAHGRTMRMDTSGPLVSGMIDTEVDHALERSIDSPDSEAPHIGRVGAPVASASESGPKLTAATRLTETGIVMGTPRFMAPEQIRGAIADHRSDQFSFCVALYHALYGVFPFPGEHMQELLDSMENRAIDMEHGVGLGARVRNALRRGLSVEPSQRFASMGELLVELEPGIRRKGGWIAGAVLLLVVMAVAYLRPQDDPCARAGDAIDSSWSPEWQVAVQAAFLRSDQPYAEAGWRSTKQRLDRYASRWTAAATAACQVTYIDRVQSEQQFDRRMLCLERGRRQVSALVSELAGGAPDAVRSAVAAAEALPDVGACSHTESLLFGVEPPSAAVASEVAVVRERLARASTLEWLGRTEESLVIAREARVTTERLKYPPVHAEALMQIARALDGRATADARAEAQGLYFDALDIAEAERHDQLAEAIWSQLVQLATRMDSGTQQAHAWWRRNEAAVRRIGSAAFEQARLHHRLGELYYRDSKYAEAADQENRAIAAISGAPEQQLELSRYYDALAKSLERLDRIDEAIRLHERAYAIASDALGPSHPNVIKLQMNYGNALRKQGQLDRARSVLEAALASMPTRDREAHLDAGKLHAFLSDLSYVAGKLDDAAAHGRQSLQIYKRAGAPERLRAEAFVNLANVEISRRNFAGALAMYEEALALRLPHLGRDHFQVGVNEGSIADALVGLARYDEAMVHLRNAEGILERTSHDRATQAWILTVRGEVLAGQQQLVAAVQVLEKAVSLLEGAPDPGSAARAMWALARALHGLGKDAHRVRQLAERARDLYASAGPAELPNRDTVVHFIERLSSGPASQSRADPTTR